MFWCVIATALVALAAVAGCSVPKATDFKPSKLFSLGDDNEPEKGIPERMVGTWTDTVLNQPGQKPQRGFGGRLIFYERNEEKPILVDGQLVVYAFDETGREVTDNRPTRRYVFPPDQMPLRMSLSEVGASYSFWLPWDEAGGPQTEVSLICRFEPKRGSVVISEQTKHLLPGTLTPGSLARQTPPKLPEGVPSRPALLTLESLQASRAANQGAQLASYESPVRTDPSVTSIEAGTPSAIPLDRRMTTTSIALPQNYTIPSSVPNVGPAAPPVPHTPQEMPAPLNATPIQASPHPPTGTPTSAGIPNPAQPQAFQTRAFGPFPTQPSIMPPAAMPTIYSPTSQRFGVAGSAPQQAIALPATTQLARSTAARTFAWNTVHATPPQIAGPPQQQQSALAQPHTITQPASQPLPGPTPLTTTINYSSAGLPQ